jgi:hypothetical protein
MRSQQIGCEDAPKMQQLSADYNSLVKAVHESYAPSAILDAEFPSESAYRIYENLFSGTESCLQNRRHIFLATDPDFFTLPWNALLTKPPPKDQKFSHRGASWLPKSYALSVLPSVRSLYRHERFRYVENGNHWNLPISAVRSSTGYVFLSTDYENSPSKKSATLIVTQLSESGRALMQRRYPIPISVGAHGPKNVVVDSRCWRKAAIQ